MNGRPVFSNLENMSQMCILLPPLYCKHHSVFVAYPVPLKLMVLLICHHFSICKKNAFALSHNLILATHIHPPSAKSCYACDCPTIKYDVITNDKCKCSLRCWKDDWSKLLKRVSIFHFSSSQMLRVHNQVQTMEVKGQSYEDFCLR